MNWAQLTFDFGLFMELGESVREVTACSFDLSGLDTGQKFKTALPDQNTFIV